MLRPDHLFELRYVRDGRLSPCGRRTVYTISRTDTAEHFELWIGDLATGGVTRLPYPDEARYARWSPDGAWIAFVGDGRLRVADSQGGGEYTALTPADWLVEGAPSWSPDSRRLALSLIRRRPASGARRISSEVYRADGVGFHDLVEQELWIVDRQGEPPRRITCGLGMCFAPEWSAQGDRILFFASASPVPFSSYSPRLMTIREDTGELREVLGSRWYVTAARWLPDGKRIAVAAARDSKLTIPTVGLWVVGANEEEASHRTQGLTGNVGCRATHDMPAWDLTNSNVICLIDNERALLSIHRGGDVEIWSVSLDGALHQERLVRGPRSAIVLDAHQAANIVLFASTDLMSPTELCTRRLDRADETRLTHLNDECLASWPRMRVERFAFRSADDLEIEAWFFARADLEGPIPTILFIHGGPFSATGQAFRYDFHLLAAQGYGLVFANFRGSAGYGEGFARAIMGHWCERAYPDHLGAVDAVVARGWADPDRLGVWGPSYGGSATCWIVGHCNRFKAAVAEAAGVNLFTRYYTSDIPDVFRRDLGGAPHELPDVYRERSPITYAHRATTPTLLLHGEEDLRCPIGEAEQFFRALKDAGCITELFRIPECSHLGDSTGPLDARRAQNEALVDWFGRFL